MHFISVFINKVFTLLFVSTFNGRHFKIFYWDFYSANFKTPGVPDSDFQMCAQNYDT